MGRRGGEGEAALTAIILGRIIDDNDDAPPVEGHHPPAVKNNQKDFSVISSSSSESLSHLILLIRIWKVGPSEQRKVIVPTEETFLEHHYLNLDP